MAKLIAGYDDNLALDTVIEYGADSSNPSMTQAQAIEKARLDCPHVIAADNWESLPEAIESFDNLINRIVSEIEATLATKH